ncbi:centrosomal protein of 70 kDa-like isoform X2 [Betta splendens]|uniref:Centrosomal protein of 70 kDa n=1 Tax=Betta splendens TaxID=158456 RepID=A0A9W2XM77_BETSP|nr:centrosomal protein of 70 kDa-like isoform X2 [Betta splendens]XP_055362862.1 centrosomal protein of 70 kDa-like isoform X2 [Betta splendens]XP_055362863.1 centrosomal protein of 70 kDa-like isoform X2 [Betta splendens]XP_055362864.1 centrosomal protein of 70 kDa-like isoform X2 [Betta splendens]XP_055362865.1 centrosomal protein of 70 kDa-like isoform X2 [Betta splendens]
MALNRFSLQIPSRIRTFQQTEENAQIQRSLYFASQRGRELHHSEHLQELQRTQLCSRPAELQRGLDKLAVRLVPWQPPDSGASSTEAVKVEDMMVLVDSLLENTCTGDDQTMDPDHGAQSEWCRTPPTPFTLGSMVSHFQKLFDVLSLSGVYPRMNEVYTRLGEMTTAIRNLRDVLDLAGYRPLVEACSCSGCHYTPLTWRTNQVKLDNLHWRSDSRVPPAEVVNTVSSLVSSTKRSAGLRDVLVDSDIDSILVKVKQHEEFFPAFHGLATELLHM